MNPSYRLGALSALTAAGLLALAGTAVADNPGKERIVTLHVTNGYAVLPRVTIAGQTEMDRAKGVTDANGDVSLTLHGEWLTITADMPDQPSATAHLVPGTTPAHGDFTVVGGNAQITVDDQQPTRRAAGASRLSQRTDFRRLGDSRLSNTILPPEMVVLADRNEPNDTRATCSSVQTNGSRLDAEINPSTDQDWYCLNLSCGDHIVVTTYPPARGRWVDTVVELYDPSGNLAASDDNGNGAPYSKLDENARATGAFAIRVISEGGQSYGGYGMTVTVEPGGTPLYVDVTSTDVPPDMKLLNATAKTDGPLTYTEVDGAAAVIDITGTGTAVSETDDSAVLVPIGFAFNYYNASHSTINVASNGYLTFQPGTFSYYYNDCFPSAGSPDDMIAPFWDDLDPSTGGQVYYQTMGSAPNRQFVAEWAGINAYGGGGPMTFEAILTEGTNSIEFRYGVMTGYFAANGSSATIGIENADGSSAKQHSCNTATLSSGGGQSFLFTKDPPVLIAYPGPQTYTVTQDTASIDDISLSGGTPVTLFDDNSVPVTLGGMTFSFYGNSYTALQFASNGYLTFGTNGYTYVNTCMPNTSQPNNMIAPFWDDFNPGAGGSVWYKNAGVAPNRTTTFLWKAVPQYYADGQHTFEAILHENGDIEFRYGTLTGAPGSSGNSGTAGIENSTGRLANQVSCNTAGNLVSGRRYFFHSNSGGATYTWYDSNGNVVSMTSSLLWNPAMGCQIRLVTTVTDPQYACPRIDDRTIDVCDTGANGGCTTLAACLAECSSSATNHGSYVSCVAHATQRLWRDGVIDKDERQGARTDAAHAFGP